jgi:hypothetical protein
VQSKRDTAINRMRTNKFSTGVVCGSPIAHAKQPLLHSCHAFSYCAVFVVNTARAERTFGSFCGHPSSRSTTGTCCRNSQPTSHLAKCLAPYTAMHGHARFQNVSPVGWDGTKAPAGWTHQGGTRPLNTQQGTSARCVLVCYYNCCPTLHITQHNLVCGVYNCFLPTLFIAGTAGELCGNPG